MKVPIKISVDYTLDFFELTRWHKRVGDSVRKGEVVLTFESQKESADKAADADGVLTEILVPQGEQVTRPDSVAHGAWGATVGYVETNAVLAETPNEGRGITLPPEVVVSPLLSVEKPRQKVRALMRTVQTEPTAESARTSLGLRASAYVRMIAAEKGVSLDSMTPTGLDGTMTLHDVELVRKEKHENRVATPAANDHELVPLTARRRGIATNLTKSWQEIPHAGSEVIIDLSRVAERRKALKLMYADNPIFARITSRWDTFVIVALVENIKEKWRIINSTFTWDGIRMHKHVNMGISLADKHGLIVPVLHRVDQINHIEIANELEALYRNVEANKLTAHDYKGATCTFNNTGVLGSHGGSSIIPYNSGSAIISLNAIGAGHRAILGIRFDHRAYDGAEALGFLNDVKKFLEHWPEDR